GRHLLEEGERVVLAEADGERLDGLVAVQRRGQVRLACRQVLRHLVEAAAGILAARRIAGRRTGVRLARLAGAGATIETTRRRIALDVHVRLVGPGRAAVGEDDVEIALAGLGDRRLVVTGGRVERV